MLRTNSSSFEALDVFDDGAAGAQGEREIVQQEVNNGSKDVNAVGGNAEYDVHGDDGAAGAEEGRDNQIDQQQCGNGYENVEYLEISQVKEEDSLVGLVDPLDGEPSIVKEESFDFQEIRRSLNVSDSSDCMIVSEYGEVLVDVVEE